MSRPEDPCRDPASEMRDDHFDPDSRELSKEDRDKRRIKELEFLLGQIVTDLPANRDWLNPDTEKAAREILKKP